MDSAIHLGKLGTPTNSSKEIADFFSDESAFYLGHGTTGNEATIQSIFETGLKVVNPKAVRPYDNHLRGLDSTTISLGAGSEHLLSYQQKLLDNWPHLQSKKIVICALPQSFVLSFVGSSSNSDLYKSFYMGSEEDGYSLRPEFIKGYYDSESKAFIPNENYYQNLDDDKKQILMDELTSSFIDNYSKSSVRSPIDDLDFPRDLVDDQRAAVQWYKVQLERLNKYTKEKEQRESIDYSHDFDDIFYGSGSTSDVDISDGWYDDSDIFVSEEDWDNFFSHSKASDFNDMMEDIKTAKTSDINSKDDNKHSLDKGDDKNDER